MTDGTGLDFQALKESAYERAENYRDCYAPSGGNDFTEADINFLATYMADWARRLLQTGSEGENDGN